MRLRHEVSGAFANIVLLKPDSTSSSTRNTRTVATMRMGTSRAGTTATLSISSRTAITGSTYVRRSPTGAASGLWRRIRDRRHSVRTIRPTGSPMAIAATHRNHDEPEEYTAYRRPASRQMGSSTSSTMCCPAGVNRWVSCTASYTRPVM